ncbi:hypothetical protein U472_11175 [Orenia metallireducens]|uniref:Hydrogenase expression/formation protein HypD n=1 Tax=Orenia metallireducens TaxID=1413210 RepID=A0A1C0A8H6_9FIRM|nr:hypothetical protein [Orenia metallireducens]OCL26545.1 hypothetical protein U472_11175 [Orenia metallireducens]
MPLALYLINILAVIAGNERFDIIMALYKVLKMIKKGINKVKNLYSSIVKAQGNLKVIATIHNIFEINEINWYRLERIQGSGLKLKKGYISFDVKQKFRIKRINKKQQSPCICEDILKGKKRPIDCRLFAKDCNPLDPKGPCMVLEEGSCNIYYQYNHLEL